MPIRIGCIVEGHGEEESVPLLIRRIAGQLSLPTAVQVLPPYRARRDKLLKHGDTELERAMELTARKVGAAGGILLLIDADDSCPAETAQLLLNRTRAIHARIATAVVLAKKEFEAWFLATAESLRGKRGLPDLLEAPEHPEEIRGAKEWLSSRMPPHGYSPTLDQPSLTALFDINQARERSASFDKCYREIVRLLAGGNTRL
jgi:hypothetical protein